VCVCVCDFVTISELGPVGFFAKIDA